MKMIYLFGAMLAVASLAGCNHPNNGETPPVGELPTPYPAQSTAPSGTSAKPSAASPAVTTPLLGNNASTGKAGTPATAASTPAMATSPIESPRSLGRGKHHGSPMRMT